MKQKILASLHCALPGNVLSFDAERQTAEAQPAVKPRSVNDPVLTDMSVFMPVPFEVKPGDACPVLFADADIDAWLVPEEPQEPKRRKNN